MLNAIDRFLQYLRVERNASDYTLKSYREDLAALADFLSQGAGGKLPLPGDITVLDLRGYVAAMHEAGYAKATIARRLASLPSSMATAISRCVSFGVNVTTESTSLRRASSR